MAAEDGVILAKALRDLPSIPEALAAYEQARRQRVEEIVAYGARTGSAKMPAGFGRVVRDVMLRLVFRYLVTDKSMEWMYGHRVKGDRWLSAGGISMPACVRAG